MVIGQGTRQTPFLKPYSLGTPDPLITNSVGWFNRDQDIRAGWGGHEILVIGDTRMRSGWRQPGVIDSMSPDSVGERKRHGVSGGR